jgi:aryl-alcohol dehydrogenase-like predicted oxidoreductase
LLSGTFNKNTSFSKGDHRAFNRDGAAFDKGETFSGIDYETGLEAVDELKKLFPQYENLSPVALQWILQFGEVSCIIPGASKPEQIFSNLKTLEIPALSPEQIKNINSIYEKKIKPLVHERW